MDMVEASIEGSWELCTLRRRELVSPQQEGGAQLAGRTLEAPERGSRKVEEDKLEAHMQRPGLLVTRASHKLLEDTGL